MKAHCDRDCFHCSLPDCIVNCFDASDSASERVVEALLFPQGTKLEVERERYFASVKEAKAT